MSIYGYKMNIVAVTCRNRTNGYRMDAKGPRGVAEKRMRERVAVQMLLVDAKEPLKMVFTIEVATWAAVLSTARIEPPICPSSWPENAGVGVGPSEDTFVVGKK